MTTAITRADHEEAPEYFWTYIDQVPDGDLREILDAQAVHTLALIDPIPDDVSLRRYAPDKWNIREVIGHVNDTERVFVFRAFWFARGFPSALPGFNQLTAAAGAAAHARSWRSHVGEFRAVRAATVTFFRGLPDEAWSRRGIADGKEFSVRALASIVAGHVVHHNRLLEERYLRT
jgi:DinB family protein